MNEEVEILKRAKEIYVFVNGKIGAVGEKEDLAATALSEDGEFLAGHICSDENFVRFDMGVNSTHKHEIYRKAYPDGFLVLWIENPGSDFRVRRAYAKHCEKYPDKERGPSCSKCGAGYNESDLVEGGCSMCGETMKKEGA